VRALGLPKAGDLPKDYSIHQDERGPDHSQRCLLSNANDFSVAAIADCISARITQTFVDVVNWNDGFFIPIAMK
jgi:hypothetical protein